MLNYLCSSVGRRVSEEDGKARVFDLVWPLAERPARHPSNKAKTSLSFFYALGIVERLSGHHPGANAFTERFILVHGLQDEVGDFNLTVSAGAWMTDAVSAKN